MTPPWTTGRIVWAEIADPNGIRKRRPAVIVTASDRISPTGPLEVVAITSQLPQPLPDSYVPLPWHSQGHPRTRLNRRCAAVCNWLSRIAVSDVEDIAGTVPAQLMLMILERMEKPASRASSESESPSPPKDTAPQPQPPPD